MRRFKTYRLSALFSAVILAVTFVSVDFAEARRGGSFGSRGTRTFQAPPATRTAPAPAAPVERSMTPSTATSPGQAARQAQPGVQQRTGGFFGGPGGLMRGLVLGGLFGMLLGYGFGGMAGLLGFALQLLLLFGLIWLAMAFFRSRRTPQPVPVRSSGRGGPSMTPLRRDDTGRAGGFTIPKMNPAGPAPMLAPMSAPVPSREIEPTQADLDIFERRLGEVQDAFSKEDHAALRRLCTPEMVSYLSEELADNAKAGLRNDVSDGRLVQADIAEAWSEGVDDYVTAALDYESVDVMRDRTSGKVVRGEETPTRAVELWTFLRRNGGDWKLSAIQET